MIAPPSDLGLRESTLPVRGSTKTVAALPDLPEILRTALHRLQSPSFRSRSGFNTVTALLAAETQSTTWTHMTNRNQQGEALSQLRVSTWAAVTLRMVALTENTI